MKSLMSTYVFYKCHMNKIKLIGIKNVEKNGKYPI
jgi:hypothetical protein